MLIINRWSDDFVSPENNPIVYIEDPSEAIWTTKDEEHIKVKDMTDAHVRNCYIMVMNTRSEYWQYIFKSELEKRGLWIV